jgi:salicylate hydroxylase
VSTLPRILIVGAGLGGLTAAIALRQRGFLVEVHEQASQLGEVGAGLTLSRGAQRVYAALGLTDALHRHASITRNMAFLHYRTGALLFGAPDHTDGAIHTDEPGGIHIHRADLHAVLVEAFAQAAPNGMFLNHRLVGLNELNGAVYASFAEGSVVVADIVIGADGLRSAVRTLLWGDRIPQFTGQVAYRCLVPGERAAPFMGAGRAAVYFGPNRVFNRYCLRGGETVNCAAIGKAESWEGEGWSTPATSEELTALYEGWHSDVIGLMHAAPRDTLIKWGLFDQEPLERWRQGPVSLLGDAAHPMLPFLGLGAAMAIEDALTLARALEADPTVVGLDRYETARRARTTQVAILSRLQGELVQARDPDTYDPSAAPAHDPAFYDFDPVSAPV